MFQDRILTECWPHPQARGREGGGDEGGAEAEGVVPAARAADLATPAPRGGGPPAEGRRPPRAGAAGRTGEACASAAGGTCGTA